MKLVAAICGFESEQFLGQTLKNLAESDIDAVHYMDGSWKNSGMHNDFSTDKTMEILAHFKGNHSIQVFYDAAYNPTHGSWFNESQKRNTQLKLIEKLFGKDTWVLVIDDDEILEPLGGIPLIFKPFLEDQLYPLGTIRTISPPPGPQLADCQVMFTPRLIKLGEGIHYHTETNMHLHREYCITICDYHNEHNGIRHKTIFDTPNVQVKNLWMLRNKERLLKKKIYYDHMENPDRIIGSCKYHE